MVRSEDDDVCPKSRQGSDRFRPLSALSLVPWTIAGGVYGYATSRIPASQDLAVFWIGNFCAPWLVLAFLAGRTQSSWRKAALAGAATDVACVAGFYLQFLTLDPAKLGLAPSTALFTVATTSLGHWVVFVTWWMVVAALGGGGYGALGWHWRRSRPLVAGLALAAPFLAEPALWPLRLGYFQGPWGLWAIEVAVGIAVITGAIQIWRHQRSVGLEGHP